MRKIKNNNNRMVVVNQLRALKMATYYMLIWSPAT
jgi:hypothetical protein